MLEVVFIFLIENFFCLKNCIVLGNINNWMWWIIKSCIWGMWDNVY